MWTSEEPKASYVMFSNCLFLASALVRNEFSVFIVAPSEQKTFQRRSRESDPIRNQGLTRFNGPFLARCWQIVCNIARLVR